VSRKTRLLLSAVALVAIVAVAWFFLISPVRSSIAETNASINEQQARLDQAKSKLAAAQSTRAEGKKNQARLLELAKMVPQNVQVPSLLVQIQDLADQAGISFTSMSPGAPSEAGDFKMIPMQLQFTGTYFDLSDFAYRVEQLVAGPGRLMAIKTISLKLGGADDASAASTSGSPKLTVDMTVYAFSMGASGSGATAATPAPAAAATGASTSSTSNKTTPN
jgi:type IV pilus assembly protein PilO